MALKSISKDQLLSFAKEVLQVEQNVLPLSVKTSDFAQMAQAQDHKKTLRIKEQTPKAQVLAFKKDES
jgi:hypothetical protein